jgi:hypothetical protein
MNLPPLSSLIRPDELELPQGQEDLLRLEAAFAERPSSRWYLAPLGTPLPSGEMHAGVCVHPWRGAWLQLNDPAADPMVALMVRDGDVAQQGILVFLDPSPEMRRAHALHSTMPRPYAMLGAEAATRCTPPDVDHRAVFPAVRPLPDINGRTVRWVYGPPPYLSAALRTDQGWVPVCRPPTTTGDMT